MKKKSRMLAMLISLMMLTTFMPMSASAVDIQSGTGTITRNTTIVGFAGHEWVVIGGLNNTSYGGTNKSITLLHYKEDTAGGFGISEFGSNHVYEGSTLHQNMETGISSIYNGFGTNEKALVEPRTLNDIAATAGSINGTLDNQHVWPLSEKEATFIDSAVTSYGHNWWSRFPNTLLYNSAYLAKYDGTGFIQSLTTGNYAVRPALNLDLSNVLFTSDTSGANAKLNAIAGSDLSAATAPTGAIKFTVKDSGLNLSIAIETAKSGNDITFSYTTSGSPDRLSAIVQASDGTVKYYGNLKDNPGASGTAKVAVPTGVASTDKLLVFAEQVNGDNLTDFASTPTAIALPADKTVSTPVDKTVRTPVYKVKLNAGKGFMYKSQAYKDSKSKKTVKSKTISVKYNAKYGKLPTAHRKGYYFKGWYTKKSGGTKVTANSIMKANNNTTLYAQYKPNGKITKCHVVKIKKSPHNKSKTIVHMKYGKTVQVIGKVDVGKNKFWYKVKYGKKTGYIYSKYVKSNKSGTKTIKIQ